MLYIILLSICSSMVGFNPPGHKHDLSNWQKKKSCLYEEAIHKAAEAAGIDKHLYMALIFVESGFNKKAVSEANACGLTQVIPRYTGGITTKKKYTCDELKNPWTSIAVGAVILKYWIHKYAKGDVRKGLCGYNAGFRCKGRKPSKGGLKYADKVIYMSEYFRKAANE